MNITEQAGAEERSEFARLLEEAGGLGDNGGHDSEKLDEVGARNE